MSYAGVESESDYAKKRYDLVDREVANNARKAGRHAAFIELELFADELSKNKRIGWETAFKRLQEAIEKGRRNSS